MGIGVVLLMGVGGFGVVGDVFGGVGGMVLF